MKKKKKKKKRGEEMNLPPAVDGLLNHESLRTPKTPCPWCGAKLDAVNGSKEGWLPSEGDVTVCLHCAEASQWMADGSLIKLDGRTLSALPQETRYEVLSCQELLRGAMAKLKAKALLAGN